MAENKKTIVVVSGLSGAGKTTSLRVFEDMGYEVIDNLPLRLLPALVSDVSVLPGRLALGVDIRNHDLTSHFEESYEALKALEGVQVDVLFLEADTDVLMRRYNETRRRHPLAVGRPIKESIALEQQLLTSVRNCANEVVDTSALAPLDLNRNLSARFNSGPEAKLQVFVMSFGFKYGLPREADIVFDVRFLKNPHWKPDLRPLTGQTEEVKAFVRQDKHYDETIANIEKTLIHQLTCFSQSDRSYVTVAIGCTGGKHRSVVSSEQIAHALHDAGFQVKCQHRELKTAEPVHFEKHDDE